MRPGLRRIGWFAALWLFGVAVLAAIAAVIRLFL